MGVCGRRRGGGWSRSPGRQGGDKHGRAGQVVGGKRSGWGRSWSVTLVAMAEQRVERKGVEGGDGDPGMRQTGDQALPTTSDPAAAVTPAWPAHCRSIPSGEVPSPFNRVSGRPFLPAHPSMGRKDMYLSVCPLLFLSLPVRACSLFILLVLLVSAEAARVKLQGRPLATRSRVARTSLGFRANGSGRVLDSAENPALIPNRRATYCWKVQCPR